MKRKTKADNEREFVQHILAAGIKSWCEMDENRHTHYCFWLKNGETRYWTNLSAQSQKLLGLNDNDPQEAQEGATLIKIIEEAMKDD